MKGFGAFVDFENKFSCQAQLHALKVFSLMVNITEQWNVQILILLNSLVL
jgi:hypothetical protein